MNTATSLQAWILLIISQHEINSLERLLYHITVLKELSHLYLLSGVLNGERSFLRIMAQGFDLF